MAKRRISQYAKEWGVKSKAVIERLEKMGVKGKRAQSGIEDSEAERVRHEMGLDAQDVAEVVGETTEQVVEIKEEGGGGRVTALDTVTRKRLKGGSLLRRTRLGGIQRSRCDSDYRHRRRRTGGGFLQ